MTGDPFDPYDPVRRLDEQMRQLARMTEDPISKILGSLQSRSLQDALRRIEEAEHIKRIEDQINNLTLSHPYSQMQESLLKLSTSPALQMEDRIQKMLDQADATNKKMLDALYSNEFRSLDRSLEVIWNAAEATSERIGAAIRLHDSTLEMLRRHADPVERAMIIDFAAEINEAATDDGIDAGALFAALQHLLERLINYLKQLPKRVAHVALIVSIISVVVQLADYLDDSQAEAIRATIHDGLEKLAEEPDLYRTSDSVHLRLEPHAGSHSITVLEPGTTVELVEDGDEWKMVSIELSGKVYTGYIKGEYLDALPHAPDD